MSKTTEPAAPEPLGDSEGTATQAVAGLKPVAWMFDEEGFTTEPDQGGTPLYTQANHSNLRAAAIAFCDSVCEDHPQLSEMCDEKALWRLGNELDRLDRNEGDTLYSAATVERLVQERNQWGAKLFLEMADEYAQGAKDADKDSRVFLSEANARCAIHLRRKADELMEGKK